MKFIDFFAGIGGMRRGMELAGHECVGFCEFDKFAIASYTSMHLITDEQREYLSTLDLKKRQKEILKEEYRNGEWFCNDIRIARADELPKADCWCFGAPCQDFSIAGKRAGLDGDRSSLVREVFRLLEQTREEERPEWLLYENVKGMLSSNRGYDFLAILLEMDECGYDIQWQLFNSKFHGVPQNRERVYTVGHLRRYGRRKIFPVGRIDQETAQLQGREIDNRVIANCLDTRINGDTRGTYVGTDLATDRQTDRQTDDSQGKWIPQTVNCGRKFGISECDVANTLMARDYKGIGNLAMSAVLYEKENSMDDR